MDRFRDLEGTGKAGRKDAALLAAIAGFEALAHPTSRDQRQFSNLFLGLFPYVRDETRRMAAAALSRLVHLPDCIAGHIADQPVRVAAPFLAFSSCVNDRMLLRAVARHGVPHARAISRRKTLSQALISALAALEDPAIERSLRVRGAIAVLPSRNDSDGAAARLRNEETLRHTIKDMARDHSGKDQTRDGTNQRGVLGQLLAKQAQSRNPVGFAECLALALRTNRTLSDRILLDPSGRQLAMALQTLEIGELHVLSILEGFFPHLSRASDGDTPLEAVAAIVRCAGKRPQGGRLAAGQRGDPQAGAAAADRRYRHPGRADPVGSTPACDGSERPLRQATGVISR